MAQPEPKYRCNETNEVRTLDEWRSWARAHFAHLVFTLGQYRIIHIRLDDNDTYLLAEIERIGG